MVLFQNLSRSLVGQGMFPHLNFIPTHAITVAILILLGILLILKIIQSLIQICRPNEIVIISGRKQKFADGSVKGYRVLYGGRGFKIPILETVHRVKLNTIEVPIKIRGAYSKGGIPLNTEAIANIKISSDPNLIGNAIERFLGRGVEEMRRVAKETLEGHLRGVLATLTPEEVNEDRLKFAESLTKESMEDLSKLGIQLDTFKILHVSDDVEYLGSIGRSAIANVVKNAEIAESNAKRLAALAEAENRQRAEVFQASTEAKVSQLENELRKIRADLEAEVRAEEEKTEAAAREARALAEQELQKIRAEMEKIRLQTDVVLPAEAQRTAEEYRAKGAAAQVLEKGRAMAEILEELHGAWKSAGPNALQLTIIEEIESILKSASEGVKKIHVDKVKIVDAGDGQAMQNYMNTHLNMLTSILEKLDETTGLNVTQILKLNEVKP